eukprot:Em0001g886a
MPVSSVASRSYLTDTSRRYSDRGYLVVVSELVEAVQHFLFGIAIDEGFKGPQANTLAWDVLYTETTAVGKRYRDGSSTSRQFLKPQEYITAAMTDVVTIVNGKLEGNDVRIMLDSGFSVSLIDKGSVPKQCIVVKMIKWKIPNFGDEVDYDIPPAPAELRDLVKRFEVLFSTVPGSTTVAHHTIPTADHPPVQVPPRRVPAHYRTEVERQLTEMLDRNIIRSVPRVYLAAYTGVVGSTRVGMSKPLLLPEPYGGEAGGWAEWVDHFKNVATVNKWATGEEKLKWLKRRFDPDSKRQLYVAELSARTRHKDEDWATFGDVLRVLADKAYPDLEEKARERLALNQFLAQIENAQVAFGVKQKRPTNVEEAVVATIELESYLGSSGKPLRVSAVSPQEPDPDVRVRRADRAEAVAAVSPLDEPQTVKLLGERLQRLEMLLERQGSSTRPRTSKQTWEAESGKRKAVVCWTCGKKGHIARFCRSRATEQHQGNFSPSVERAYHLSIPFLSKTTTEQGVTTVGLVLKEKTVVPVGSEMEVMVKIAGPVTNGMWVVGHKLGESEREQLNSLLVEFADVFSFSSKDLGRTKELKHHIFTSDAQPVHLSPRRIPQARREELRGLLRDMLESDVIQQSDSPWSSPIVLAKKHDGTTRFCVDYRKVNEVTRKDAYPLPRVDDTLDTLVGSKFFTTLDLASGYWQVEVAPEDQPKTAFTTPEGLYQFKMVLQQIQAKLRLCRSGPFPRTEKKFNQFLGLANYYRRFVKDFALISKPLQRLTEKNAPFEWTIGCQNAFDELRKRLVSSPVLAYPDYERRFILDTDASDVGIGAVLSQVSDCGSERVIAYASRSLTRPEQRQYLLGREFTLRTDHGSLVWIRNFKEPEGQLARWLERLQEYNFTVVHRQGLRHCNADALSRCRRY